MLQRLPKRRCEYSRENPHFGSGVRQMRRLFQARIWLGNSAGGSINLGLYESPVTAQSVLRDVRRQVPNDAWTPLEIWRTAVNIAGSFSGDAVEVLRALLPKWVDKSFDGKHFVAKVKSKALKYENGGFLCRELAHLDALRVWQQTYGSLKMPMWRLNRLVDLG
jgi:hypothetical protein